MFTALIACDRPSVAERVEATLRLQWPAGIYRREDSGTEAAKVVREDGLDLIVLDLGVRTGDALDAIAAIRRRSTVPILTIDAAPEGADWERGVALGADEYVPRSFSPIELLARTKAVMGRGSEHAVVVDWKRVLDVASLSDDAAERIRALTADVCLTWPELTLLRRLVVENGRVVPVRTLAALLWDHDEDATAYLRVYVRRVREKIEPEPNSPRHLVTGRGIGYCFV